MTVDLAGRPRWHGQPGRLEVHYVTATDTTTGTGLWLHHEVVAPTTGEPYGHGWLTLFPVDGSPANVPFGPSPVEPLDDGRWFSTGDIEMTATTARGRAGSVDWDLHWDAGVQPLWTFPRWVWQRQALPAAQVVPIPSTQLGGTLDGKPFSGDGGIAHIYGHGNAKRWVWFHGDLGGGDVLEIVAATAVRRGLRALPPLPLVQLRLAGHDWPREPLAAAPLFRARIDDNAFKVRGTVGRRRLRVDVSLPPDRCVVLGYADPDGATATCTNSERADARIRLERLAPTGWRSEHTWQLDGTAHAEIGTRP